MFHIKVSYSTTSSSCSHSNTFIPVAYIQEPIACYAIYSYTFHMLVIFPQPLQQNDDKTFLMCDMRVEQAKEPNCEFFHCDRSERRSPEKSTYLAESFKKLCDANFV